MSSWLAFRTKARGAGFTAALAVFKAAVPSTSRRWDDSHGYWLFDPNFAGAVEEIPGSLIGAATSLVEDDRRLGRAAVREGERLDTTLIDSMFGDRVLFSAQLSLAEGGPMDAEKLIRLVVNAIEQQEACVREVLRENRGRFAKLADGRVDVSEEAPK